MEKILSISLFLIFKEDADDQPDCTFLKSKPNLK